MGFPVPPRRRSAFCPAPPDRPPSGPAPLPPTRSPMNLTALVDQLSINGMEKLMPQHILTSDEFRDAEYRQQKDAYWNRVDGIVLFPHGSITGEEITVLPISCADESTFDLWLALPAEDLRTIEEFALNPISFKSLPPLNRLRR